MDLRYQYQQHCINKNVFIVLGTKCCTHPYQFDVELLSSSYKLQMMITASMSLTEVTRMMRLILLDRRYDI